MLFPWHSHCTIRVNSTALQQHSCIKLHHFTLMRPEKCLMQGSISYSVSSYDEPQQTFKAVGANPTPFECRVIFGRDAATRSAHSLSQLAAMVHRKAKQALGGQSLEVCLLQSNLVNLNSLNSN
ncbi:unnamed protein product [Ixodes persulcatus]